jgi:CRP-like cAMP-binding protein
MEDKNRTNLASIDKKMSVMISLLLKIANNGNEISLKEQIRDLSAFGLTSAEIADIVGKKVGHVSKELSELKKKDK